MAGSTNFKVFNQNLTNMMDDANYNTSNYRLNGAVSGLAPSNIHNKLYYQVSTMVAALAQSLANKGYDVLDNNYANLITVLSKIALQTDNVASATKLQMARKINGVNFDGSADITITAAASGGDADTVDGKHATDFILAENSFTKTTDPTNRDLNNFLNPDTYCHFDTGAGAVLNTPLGTLAFGSGIVATVRNIGISAGRFMQCFELYYPSDIVGRWYRVYRAEGTTFSSWKQIATVDQLDAGHSYAQNGWQKLNGELILQWGYVAPTTADYLVTFPISFPKACIYVGASGDAQQTNNVEYAQAGSINKNNFTWSGCIYTTGFVPAAVRGWYFAIGY